MHSTRQTHLEFYREHGIAPVRYDLHNMDAHLERRFSLYARLGLLPISFKHAKVLEVAAGTGHNSLYVAQLMPSELVLVEPNETAVEYIKKAYQDFDKPHTSPNIIDTTIEAYSPHGTFDIVLCENWLGTSTHELSLLKKISEMVAEKGIFVLTTISPIGFVPNVLRRFLANYIAPLNKTFEERIHLLASAFGSHLDTLSAMTRSKIDWVQDNMINPAYFGLCLHIPLLLAELGDLFDVIGSCPDFSVDWRWFKGLYGKDRRFNQHFLEEYEENAYNFLDHRLQVTVANNNNMEIEKKALELIKAIELHEDAHINQGDILSFTQKVLHLLDGFIALLPRELSLSIRALNEVRRFIEDPFSINIISIAKMSDFCGLFGRETVYVSLQKTLREKGF